MMIMRVLQHLYTCAVVSLNLQFRKLAALVPKRPWGFSHVGKRDVESGGSSADEDCVDSDEEAGPGPDPVSTIVL